MKSFVITVTGLDLSLEVANRCIDSASQFGIDVDIFDAITPKDDPLMLLKKYQINEADFETKYSRKLNGICCFLSHYSLWKRSLDTNKTILILEHDAIITAPIDKDMKFKKLINLGKPSFGSFKIPPKSGINPLTSKMYLPGAHAYMINPEGAAALIVQTKVKSKFADTFINIDTFPWIEEYYPWPVMCNDSFTTVQAELGCKAKHNFNKNFRIV
jgi:glycosyl transferase family 25